MNARLFLGLNALLWVPYGIYCFLNPGFLGDAAGVVSTTATGSTEIRAMYGGLEAGIGALCLAAYLRADLERPALVTLAFLAGGLFAARFAGSALDYGWSLYTGGAMALEATILCASVWLLRREGAPA